MRFNSSENIELNRFVNSAAVDSYVTFNACGDDYFIFLSINPHHQVKSENVDYETASRVFFDIANRIFNGGIIDYGHYGIFPYIF